LAGLLWLRCELIHWLAPEGPPKWLLPKLFCRKAPAPPRLEPGVAGGVAAGVPKGVPAGVVDVEKRGLNSLALGLNEKDLASGLRLDFDAGGRGGCPVLDGPAPAHSVHPAVIIVGSTGFPEMWQSGQAEAMQGYL